MIEWQANLEIISPNRHPHWTKQQACSKRNRTTLGKLWLTEPIKPKVPCLVRIERCFCAYAKIMDYDNYIAACKSIRDSIAELLIPGLPPGRADFTSEIVWEYLQTKSNQNIFKIKITEID